MYRAEPKDVKQKKPSWRISGHTHVACKQTISAMSGFDRRKWEEKGQFSCILENLFYSNFNMYLHGWVLTFILILTGTTNL